MACITSRGATIPGTNKYVLNFDLDDTLFEVDTDNECKEGEHPGVDTYYIRVETLCDTKLEFDVMCRIQAIARERFRELFRKIRIINEEAKETVIFVNIITNAKYAEKSVVEVLKHFYGDDFAIHTYANCNREIPSKGLQMLEDYIFKYCLLKIPKDHIYLIDDLQDNCQDATTWDFKAIQKQNDNNDHLDEDDDQSNYDIFECLNKIVDSVMEAIFAKS